MVVATGTVTVNAAFLHEIKQDNVELKQVLSRLDFQVGHVRNASGDIRLIAELLVRLRDQLAFHFSLEEAFGYFEDATDVAPRLSQRAEELRAEHVKFFVMICQICDRAEQLVYRETGQPEIKRILARFAAFHDGLRQHERRERELIMEAFDDDIGVGD